jgi:NAD(P)-dependent dehydrogenase (short-subunit alcohol dehydrogenase family)
MPRLQGKVALITGGGTGIGRATAILFAREGASVAIADIDAGAGEETARLAGNGAIAIRTDVTEPDSIQKAIRSTVATFGGLDVLHNNAGGSTAQDNTAVEAPLDEFWRDQARPFRHLSRLPLRHSRVGQGGGRLGHQHELERRLDGVPGRDCYTAAKGGIAVITRSLAVAYAPQKVRVNAIAPSATMTERVRRLVAGNAAMTKLADSHLLGLIEPGDIAQMALYLASDESRW